MNHKTTVQKIGWLIVSGTKHHRKQKHQHCGEDLWSKRPCSGNAYNAYNKKLTRQTERAMRKQIILNDMNIGEYYEYY